MRKLEASNKEEVMAERVHGNSAAAAAGAARERVQQRDDHASPSQAVVTPTNEPVVNKVPADAQPCIRGARGDNYVTVSAPWVAPATGKALVNTTGSLFRNGHHIPK